MVISGGRMLVMVRVFLRNASTPCSVSVSYMEMLALRYAPSSHAAGERSSASHAIEIPAKRRMRPARASRLRKKAITGGDYATQQRSQHQSARICTNFYNFRNSRQQNDLAVDPALLSQGLGL